MSDLVLYRKHRPKRFEEVAGQDHVVKTVSYSIARGEPAHAYIFSGQRGVGKTTVARLLAKAVNCEKVRKNNLEEKQADLKDIHFEPCNECEPCEAVEKGTMDIQEMDAASNRGIDEIRELIDSIKYPPSRLEKKVVIVDEVHMLTKEAFNALLKTLEEPPEHAIFVLATTEIEKVPDTIVSRCQRFDFKKLTLPQIQKRLKGICEKEGIEAEDDALRLLAINSGGSMRDAESLLQQVITQVDDKLSLEMAKETLGVVDEEELTGFVDSIIQKEPDKALEKIDEVLNAGKELAQFATEIVQYFRFLMLAQVSGELLEKEFLTDSQLEWAKKRADDIDSKDTAEIVENFSEAERSLQEYPLPQIALEVAVIESVDLLEKE